MAIVSKPEIKVRTSEDFASSNFRIEASPEAFRILSDGLYSNKVKAVIRELSTNAVDSLVDADTVELGYEVHLPTYLEPEFSIRDYGTGLQHEAVVGLYTTYFGSNKTNSNDFTGQLGLGSKSPFAYTDSFTVTSYKDGVKRVYNAHISESGYPAISLLTENDTDEHNGIEIRFAVKNSDTDSFEEEASEVYQYFSVRPTFIGVNPEIQEFEKTLEGTNWHMSKSRHRGSALAVMGNIAYPIGKIDTDDKAHVNLLDTSVVIEFNIGDLDITPSRESLSMSKRTIENIKFHLDFVISEIKGEVQKRFDECDNLWDARVLSASLFGTWNSPLYHLGNVCRSGDISYKGKPVQIDNRLGLSDIAGVSIYRFHKDGYGSNYKRETRHGIPCDDTKMFIDDLPATGAYSRCKEWSEKNSQDCYLIRLTRDGIKNNPILEDEFFEFTGMKDDVLSKVSELPKPTRYYGGGGRSGTGVRKDKVLKFDSRDWHSSKSDYWDSCEVDFDNGGLYVEISRYNVVDFDATEWSHVPMEPDDLKKLIQNINDEFSLDIEVYGVKSANISRYRKSDEWTNLWDYLPEVVSDEDKMMAAKKAEVNSDVMSDLDFHFRFFAELHEHLSVDSDIKTFCKVLSDMAKLHDDDSHRQFNDILRKLDIKNLVDVNPISTRENLEKKNEEIKQKYPITELSTNGETGYWGHKAAYKGFEEGDWKIVAQYVEKS